MIAERRAFYKMTGSGNDFVFVDARSEPPGELATPEVVQRICARGTGIGADGIVFLLPSQGQELRIRYLNADGSIAELCGNATLCATRLAYELGVFGSSRSIEIETDSGIVRARMRDGSPEIDLAAASEIQARFDAAAESGERAIGFARVGVPHLVVRSDDSERAPVVERGRRLRHHPALAAGANVNFVSPIVGGRWAMRTYERGVEGETLACGTGAVATAALLRAWGEAGDTVELVTRSGRVLTVHAAADGRSSASLSGEGRVVFVGRLAEL